MFSRSQCIDTISNAALLCSDISAVQEVPAATNGVGVEMEMGVVEDIQNFSTDETKYVDPRNYHSPYDALSALRVDEIPPREIKLSQPLGEGM